MTNRKHVKKKKRGGIHELKTHFKIILAEANYYVIVITMIIITMIIIIMMILIMIIIIIIIITKIIIMDLWSIFFQFSCVYIISILLYSI